MLILGRYVGESVMINDNIEIVVMYRRGVQVSLGFDAPRDVDIQRKEIYLRMKAQKEQTK